VCWVVSVMTVPGLSKFVHVMKYSMGSLLISEPSGGVIAIVTLQMPMSLFVRVGLFIVPTENQSE